MLPRRYWLLGAVVVPYTLAAVAVSIATRNVEFLYYSLVLTITVVLVVWLDQRSRVPMAVLWGLAAWGLVHLLGGTVPIPPSLAEPGSPPNLYNLRPYPWLPKYDQVVHALGFGVGALAAWAGLRATYEKPPRIGVGLFVVVVLLGMGLGAMNEVIEFAATQTMTWTNVGGYENTGWDLVSNLVGSLGAAGVVAWQEKSKSQIIK